MPLNKEMIEETISLVLSILYECFLFLFLLLNFYFLFFEGFLRTKFFSLLETTDPKSHKVGCLKFAISTIAVLLSCYKSNFIVGLRGAPEAGGRRRG